MRTRDISPSSGLASAFEEIRARAERGELHREDRLDLADGQLTGRPVETISELMRMSISRDASAAAFGETARPLAVDLRLNPLGPTVGLDLGRATFVQRLASINLGGTHLGDQGLERLCASNLRHLQHLAIWSNGIGPDGVAALVASSCWQSLSNVEMADNDLGDEGSDLVAQTRAPRLVRLDLQ